MHGLTGKPDLSKSSRESSWGNGTGHSIYRIAWSLSFQRGSRYRHFWGSAELGFSAGPTITKELYLKERQKQKCPWNATELWSSLIYWGRWRLVLQAAKKHLEDTTPGTAIYIVTPQMAVTKDYRLDRVRVMCDDNNKVDKSPRRG